MHKRPLFSVIINNYNYGRYIEEAIESLLNQTFLQDDLEIIVVDDGSTDDTSERVIKYEDKIRYIPKKNGGQASALNVGVENSNGEIIAFLDADDYWHPGKLECVAEEFDKDEHLDFVYHFMNVVDDAHKILDRYIYPLPLPVRQAGPGETYLDKYLRGNLPWFSPTSGMTVRADCLKKAGPIPEDFRIGADLYLHYILPFHARELLLVRKPLGYYRIHGSNLSGGNLLTPEKVRREIGMLMSIRKHVKEEADRLGHDGHLIDRRLESSIMAYRIVLDCLNHEKLTALRNILSYKYFLPGDGILSRFSRKLTLFSYIFFPAWLSLWLQKRYRDLLCMFFSN